MGVACGHIKGFGLFPFPHQRKLCAEGLQGRHALSTCMLGRTLQCIIILIEAVYDKCLINSRVAERVVVVSGEPDFMTKDLPKNY